MSLQKIGFSQSKAEASSRVTSPVTQDGWDCSSSPPPPPNPEREGVVEKGRMEFLCSNV